MPRPAEAAADPAVIGKGINVLGEVTGVDSLSIDGTVEGTIHIPGGRVTVGRNGRVIAAALSGAAPCILAREIVIIGTVTGNVEASERVDIRAQASLTGNVSTVRVAVEDGACFRGGIDIRRTEKQPEAAEASHGPKPAPETAQKSALREIVQV